ncbi:Gfo/Idh/MocA family protein [Streptomyces inhibens]|uniref:Gfo/Idh/MocA family protein n=1 Tax=Streptomyces inhibens TaxID=2293571 RepID=UPI001EE6B6C0|nr:Gfo/Idh/MocA family oxidoreductase [Streptomyces inhibens]UKY51797.1 Gfo/Idh/MocA family oxidoreductase [Streptomyces inhibens]
MNENRDGSVALGVVGCASIARRRMLPSMLRQPLIDVVAVASRTPAKAAAFAAEFNCEAVTGYDELLKRDDLDAVYIPLPPGMHPEWTIKALRAGKHVLCEKPFAATRPEALQAVTVAREEGLLLMESFMFLHHSQHTAIAKLISDGVIGELHSFSSEFGFPPLPAGEDRYLTRHASALLEVGVYPVRAAQLYLGGELDVLGAHLRPARDGGLDVGGSALLSAPSGVTAQLTFGLTHFYRCEYTLWGSEGKLSLSRAFTTPDTHSPVVRIERQDHVEELTLPADQQFVNISGAFADAILKGNDFAPHGDAILRQADLIDGIRKSAMR